MIKHCTALVMDGNGRGLTRLALFSGLLLAGALPAQLTAQTAVFAGAQRVVGTNIESIGIAVDNAGNIYATDINNRAVVKYPLNGTSPVTVVKDLQYPLGVAVDAAGDVFVAEADNNRILEVRADGNQYTFNQIVLNFPYGVAVDGSGGLYVADHGNDRVVHLDANGALLSTVGSSFESPEAVAVNLATGAVYIADSELNKVFEVPMNGTQTTVGTNLNGPSGVAVDGAGNVYIADLGNNRVVEVPTGGGGQTVVGSGFLQPWGVATDRAGNIAVADYGNFREVEIEPYEANFGPVNVCASGQTTPAPCSATMTLNFNLTDPSAIFDFGVQSMGASGEFQETAAGTCPYSNPGASCTAVVMYTPTKAGTSLGAHQFANQSGVVLESLNMNGLGVAPEISFGSTNQLTVGTGLLAPSGVAMDGAGNVYIADSLNQRVVEVPAGGGAQTTLPIPSIFATSVAVDGAGDVLISDLSNGDVEVVPKSGSPSGIISGMKSPVQIAVDPAGDIYVADSGQNTIVELSSPFGVPGISEVQVGGLLDPQGVAVDTLGDLFIADTGNNRVIEVNALNGAQTVIGSGLTAPVGLAVDAAGDLFIADSGNNRIEEVLAGGTQITLASGFKDPIGVFVDKAGDVFVADQSNNRVVELPQSKPPALTFATSLDATTSSDSPQTVVAQNIGNQPLTIADVNYPVDFPIDFAENGSEELCIGSLVLAAGQTCDMPINFTPIHLGTLNETLTINDNALNVSNALQSIALKGISISSPPSTLSSPTPSSTLTGSSVTFSWTTVSGSSGYAIWIGNTGVGSLNLYSTGVHTNTSVSVTNLPTNGGTINVRLYTSFNGTLAYNDYTFTAAKQAAMTSPAPSSTLTGPSATFTWAAATPAATGYAIWIGSVGIGSNDLYSTGVHTTTSAAVAGLPTTGGTIYVRLWTSFNGTLVYTDYTYTEATRAAMTSPAQGSTLTASSAVFTWSAGTGATGYAIWIGSTGAGSNNLYSTGVHTNTTVTVNGLPTNGEELYVRLWTSFNGTLVSTDYTYTAK